jgi:hypothetical protein
VDNVIICNWEITNTHKLWLGNVKGELGMDVWISEWLCRLNVNTALPPELFVVCCWRIQALEDTSDAMPLGKQFKTSGTTHPTTQYHIPEDWILSNMPVQALYLTILPSVWPGWNRIFVTCCTMSDVNPHPSLSYLFLTKHKLQ